ncbi:MAG: hypothetical protein GY937_12295 [bacterium]|nr:hypothetical protein [bacterium]
MGRSKAERNLTPTQRRWLSHLRRCAREGETVRGYAKRHRLSEYTLYTATRDLRAKGVLPPAKRGARTPRKRQRESAHPQRFIEVKAARSGLPLSGSPWRARLPNGVMLEGSSPLGPVVEALARL